MKTISECIGFHLVLNCIKKYKDGISFHITLGPQWLSSSNVCLGGDLKKCCSLKDT